jgi:hypothetical protein
MNCGWCGRPLKSGEARRVPWPLALLGSVAAGFFHGGLWAYYGLKRPFCPRCYWRVLPALCALTLLVLGAAAAGVALWITAAVRFSSARR